MEVFSMLFIPFAWLLRALYFLFNSYGVALIIFCLITKILLFPLSLKGKKSMITMNALSSKQQQLQKQYGKDRERFNQEVQKLYEKERVNPMGGCLWSMLPLPILIGLYGVIQRPLRYLMSLSSDEINELSNFLLGNVLSGSRTAEIKIAQELFGRVGEAAAHLPHIAGRIFNLDFHFLGIDLAATPQWNPANFEALNWNSIGLFLIPFISAGLAFLSMRISMKTNTRGGNESAVPGNKAMILTMPLMSLWIGFTLPAALGIYWISNNVFTMLQEVIAGKILKKDYEEALLKMQEREKLEKEEEKERKRQAAEAKARQAAENKKKQVERKTSGETLANSRVGIRAYARGRAYEPDRFGGVTLYRDPSLPADETAAAAEQEDAGAPSPADEVRPVPSAMSSPSAPESEGGEYEAEAAEEAEADSEDAEK